VPNARRIALAECIADRTTRPGAVRSSQHPGASNDASTRQLLVAFSAAVRFSLTLSYLGAGVHTLTATYSGDSNHRPSSATLTQVVKATTSTSLTVDPQPRSTASP
jgi:hypothetical protein